MSDEEKQIEEMAGDIEVVFNYGYVDFNKTAEKLYAKGYRKALEVAIEIIDLIDGWFMYCEKYSGHIIKDKLAELKRNTEARYGI